MLIDGFPAVTKAADQFEIGKDLSGLIVRDGAGKARSGVFYRGSASATLLTPRTDMAVDAQAFEGVAERRSGVIFNVNDGATAVALNRPTANSHIALIYWKQRVAAAPWSDGADGPVFGVIYGDPAAIPTKPALNIEGAVEIGTVQIPSNATSTSSSGVIITTTAPYTTTVGSPIPVRHDAERNAIVAFQGLKVDHLANGRVEQYYATYDATANPAGTATAGWYPVAERTPLIDTNGALPTQRRLIVKTGALDIAFSGGVGRLNFPTAFPNALISLVVTSLVAGASAANIFDQLSATGARLAMPNSFSATARVHYVAYGY